MTANHWLSSFSELFNKGQRDSIAELFQQDSYWRDYLPFGDTLQTIEGRADICEFYDTVRRNKQLEKVKFHATLMKERFSNSTNEGFGQGGCLLGNVQHCSLSLTFKQRKLTPKSSDPFILIVGWAKED